MDFDNISNMLWLVASQMGIHATVWLLAARLLPQERPALLHWALFMVLLGCGVALAGLRSDTQRVWYTYNGVNFITVLGFVVMRIGTERFVGLAPNWRRHWLLPLPAWLVLVALPPSADSAPWRLAVAYGTQALLMAWLMWSIAPPLRREFGLMGSRAIVWPGTVMVLMMGYLALRQILHWGGPGEIHQPGPASVGLMYAYLLGSAAFNFGFMALVLQRLNTRLREQAVRDSLTGLLNRRAMDAALERQWARQQRARAPLSVLMVDVDHFKAFNDRSGHAAGDELLRQLAQLLRHERRTDDAVGRVGGEEFLVLLPGVSAVMAAELAERLRESVRNAKLGVTVSIGVSQSGGREDDVDNLLRRADAALYRAKSLGRDRVEVAH